MRKRVLWMLLTIIVLFSLTGCDIQIFEDKSAKNVAKEYKKEELERDIYYIKDGTSFYKAYKCDASSNGTELDNKKSCWLIDDEKMVPTYYKDGLIARMTTDKIDDESVVMERYEDCGYSIGVHGCTFENGYICFRVGNNTIKDTSIEKKLEKSKSQNIMIESINGTYVSERMLNEAGIITGLEQDKEYKITYFAGSVYDEMTLTADTHFFECFEAYKLDEFNMTKNGYISLTVPDDLKTGYYRLDGEGFFRYVAAKKGEIDLANADYNTPYYESEEDQMAVFSQQYVFNLDKITENMSVKADFDPNTVLNSTGSVKMMVTSPDKKRMTVEAFRDDGTISCDIKESTPGEWIVNISPQSMKITNIEVISNEDKTEATKEEKQLVLDKDMTGIVVTLDYEGSGTVTAQIVDPINNKSYDMILKNDDPYDTSHQLIYNFPYLAAGTYSVNIYHYPDTKINELSYYLSEDVKEIEIIEIEE